MPHPLTAQLHTNDQFFIRIKTEDMLKYLRFMTQQQ